MAERIQSSEVIAEGAVGDVHPETDFERYVRVLRPVFKGLGLYVIVGAMFVVCVYILFSTNPDLDHYRSGAWSMLTTLAGGAVGALFGSNVLPKSDA